MAPVSENLLELPASFLEERGVIRVLEGPDADVGLIKRLLQAGEYPRPFVVDDGKVRRLHFSLALVQSEMLLESPHALHLAYTREMMGFLPFRPRPRHVVIVGLGGGSLTKFCYRHLPRSRVTTLEIDADVMALRGQFLVPENDERLQILRADAVEYFATSEVRADVVLLDGYDENGIAPAFCDERFYLNVRGQLRTGGVLVCNLAVKGEGSDAHLALLREVFNERVLVQEVAGDGNRVAYAFNDERFPPDWDCAEREARALLQRIGLDFSASLNRMARQWARQRRRR